MPQYKGTPHPRKRKPLEAITNNQNASKNGARNDLNESSSLKRLHNAHSTVARVLDKIDTIVSGIHKKKLSEKLSSDEIDRFTKTMSTMESTLEEWHNFFLQVSKRSDGIPCTGLLGKKLKQSVTDLKNDDLIPILQRSIDGGILSSSPLVAASRTSKNSDDDTRKTLRFTPEFTSAASKKKKTTLAACSNNKKVSFATPTTTQTTPINSSSNNSNNSSSSNSNSNSSSRSSKKVTFSSTPELSSPLRSVRLRRPSMSSTSSCLPATPSPFNIPSSNNVTGRFTSRFTGSSGDVTGTGTGAGAGSECWKTESPEDVLNVSPPKTCMLMTPGEEHQEFAFFNTSPSAMLSSPFRTPGLKLRSPSFVNTPECSSGGSDVTSRLASLKI